MPLYDFRCHKCKFDFEEFAPMSAPVADCPKCGKRAKRQISTLGKPIVSPESSAKYQKWFHSEQTQAKLRSGEYQIMPKSHDANHE